MWFCIEGLCLSDRSGRNPGATDRHYFKIPLAHVYSLSRVQKGPSPRAPSPAHPLGLGHAYMYLYARKTLPSLLGLIFRLC